MNSLVEDRVTWSMPGSRVQLPKELRAEVPIGIAIIANICESVDLHDRIARGAETLQEALF